jgi:two-component system, cell cycle response regulator DivK
MAGEKILVVEDNPLNMELITDILESNSYCVVQAMAGAEAIELAKSECPALILMDIQLPGLDGLTITGVLKDDPATRSIPVVALTAHAMRGDEERARQAGCDGYISKPIDTRQLPITIRSFIDA